MSLNFDGDTVFVYDEYGATLASTKVLLHDTNENYIEIEKHPSLYNGMRCAIFILSKPVPYVFSGVVRANASSSANVLITLFKGKVKENRSAARYKIAGPAEIISYVDDRKYALHRPIKIELVNISVSGVRFSTRKGTLSLGDQFELKLEVGGYVRVLTAKAINSRDSSTDEDCTEYGCRFIGKTDG